MFPRVSSVGPEGRTRQGRYREELQARHYARRTVTTYEQWEMGSAEVNAFLNRLVRAHQPRRLPVVLTPEEDRAVLQRAARKRCAGGWAALRQWVAADGGPSPEGA